MSHFLFSGTFSENMIFSRTKRLGLHKYKTQEKEREEFPGVGKGTPALTLHCT
jgi:hypothetical protein